MDFKLAFSQDNFGAYIIAGIIVIALILIIWVVTRACVRWAKVKWPNTFDPMTKSTTAYNDLNRIHFPKD